MYQIYVTDRLKAITGVEARYYDLVYGNDKPAPDAEETKGRLKDKLNALRE